MSPRFQIKVADAFSNGETFEGTIEVISNDIVVLPATKTKRLNLCPLLRGIDSDVRIPDRNQPSESDAILVTGCGVFGCCPALMACIIHDGDFVRITGMFWWDCGPGKPQIREIQGEAVATRDDYECEVRRLERIWYSCQEKSNRVLWKHPSRKRKASQTK